MTALTVYASFNNSSRLTSADLLVSSSGASGSASGPTNIGSSTGWMEIGYGGPGSFGLGSIQSPTGNGAFLDATVLEGKVLFAGNYSGTISLSIDQSSKSVQGTMVLRFYKYNTSTPAYTSIGSITQTSRNVNSTSETTFSFSATALPSMAFATNESLYVDVWFNITSNNMTSGGNLNTYFSNDGALGYSGVQFVTPGYGTPTRASVVMSAGMQAGYFPGQGGSL